MTIPRLSLGSGSSFLSKTVFPCLLAAALSACEGTGASDDVETNADPIYGGVPLTGMTSGIVEVVGCTGAGCAVCSGTIFSDYWVLTAAHCIANLDADNDGQITTQEGAGSFWVGPGPDSSYGPKYITAQRIFKHPTAVWGTTTGADAALVWLGSPNEVGYATALLSSHMYTGIGTGNVYLNLFFAPSSAILGKTVYSYGYGPDGAGNGYGTLRMGAKTVAMEYAGGYAGSGNTACPGDSGGPDLFVNSQNYWFVSGIHSSGYGCNGGMDWQKAAETWRDWVYSMWNTCPDRTAQGRCYW